MKNKELKKKFEKEMDRINKDVYTADEGYEINERKERDGIWSFIHSAVEAERKQLEREIKGLKVGNWKDWIKATKKYGGSKEEWNKLQTNKNWDEMLQVVLDLLKKETKK